MTVNFLVTKQVLYIIFYLTELFVDLIEFFVDLTAFIVNPTAFIVDLTEFLLILLHFLLILLNFLLILLNFCSPLSNDKSVVLSNHIHSVGEQHFWYLNTKYILQLIKFDKYIHVDKALIVPWHSLLYKNKTKINYINLKLCQINVLVLSPLPLPRLRADVVFLFKLPIIRIFVYY